MDEMKIILCGVLVWSLLMIGVQMGNAMSDAWDRRRK